MKPKTVLFIDSPSFGKEDMIDAMKKKGFDILLFYHDSIYSNPNDKDFDTAFAVNFIGREIFFVFSFNFYPSVAGACDRRKIPYLSFVYDNPLKALYSYSIIHPTNFVFLFDKATYWELSGCGIQTVYYLPLCANVERLSKMKLPTQKLDILSSDVSFVGSLYNEKHNLFDRMTGLDDFTKGYLEGIMEAQQKISGYFFIEELLIPDILSSMKKSMPYNPNKYGTETDSYIYANYFIARKITSIERFRLLHAVSENFKTKLYTHNPTPELPHIQNMGAINHYEVMPHVFKHSKINLNISLRSIKTGIPLRCFDIMGAGGFLLSNYQADFFDFFKPKEDFDYYDGKEDLLSKIEYYLVHEKERKEIAENALQKMEASHTYHHRLTTMLEIAELL